MKIKFFIGHATQRKLLDESRTSATLPRQGDRVVIKGGEYVVETVQWDFDNDEIRIQLR